MAHEALKAEWQKPYEVQRIATQIPGSQNELLSCKQWFFYMQNKGLVGLLNFGLEPIENKGRRRDAKLEKGRLNQPRPEFHGCFGPKFGWRQAVPKSIQPGFLKKGPGTAPTSRGRVQAAQHLSQFCVLSSTRPTSNRANMKPVSTHL